ncbi:unnamed protein product [Rhizoctonia solani]|nr:unnamed protein product [Rhizoctonia solani]
MTQPSRHFGMIIATPSETQGGVTSNTMANRIRGGFVWSINLCCCRPEPRNEERKHLSPPSRTRSLPKETPGIAHEEQPPKITGDNPPPIASTLERGDQDNQVPTGGSTDNSNGPQPESKKLEEQEVTMQDNPHIKQEADGDNGAELPPEILVTERPAAMENGDRAETQEEEEVQKVEAPETETN